MLMANSEERRVHVWWADEPLGFPPTGGSENDVAIRIALGDEALSQPPASSRISLRSCGDLGDEAAPHVRRPSRAVGA
jgi:hypothetical protein